MFNKHIAKNNCKIYNVKGNQVAISIHSRKIGEDLLTLGYDNLKTYTCKSLPKLSDKMFRHFIRGYIDGDGSVSIGKNGHNRRLNISAFNIEILEQIESKLPKLLGKVYYTKIGKINRYVNGNLAKFKGCNMMDIADKGSLILIYDYIYKYSKYYLKRKKEKFDKVIA